MTSDEQWADSRPYHDGDGTETPDPADMTCPAPESLVLYALGRGNAITARHVSGCDSCQCELHRLREAVTELRSGQGFEHLRSSPDCLDEITLADAVDGRLAGEARERAIAHLASCAHCRREVSAVSRLTRETASAAPGALPGARRRRHLSWAVPLGAVAAMAIGAVLLRGRSDDREATSPLREARPALAPEGAPKPIAPIGAVSAANRVLWSSAPRATRYRVRLYRADGSVLLAKETPDTTLDIRSVRLTPGETYSWRVDAETAAQRWTASELVDFHIVRGQ